MLYSMSKTRLVRTQIHVLQIHRYRKVILYLLLYKFKNSLYKYNELWIEQSNFIGPSDFAITEFYCIIVNTSIQERIHFFLVDDHFHLMFFQVLMKSVSFCSLHHSATNT